MPHIIANPNNGTTDIKLNKQERQQVRAAKAIVAVINANTPSSINLTLGEIVQKYAPPEEKEE